MSTLKKLIQISNLDISDSKQKLFTELAILEDSKVSEIKKLSPEAIDLLISKYYYLYSGEEIQPDYKFKLNNVEYKLPVTLKGKPYALFEDIELILASDNFGTTNWEKLRYLLYIVLYKGDITSIKWDKFILFDTRENFV